MQMPFLPFKCQVEKKSPQFCEFPVWPQQVYTSPVESLSFINTGTVNLQSVHLLIY